MKKLYFGLISFLITSQALSSPIQTSRVFQYECLVLDTTWTRLNSYFNPQRPPLPVTPYESSRTICHDIAQYGPADSEVYPRLNQKQTGIKLWNANDDIFYDLNHNNQMDFNDLVDVAVTKKGSTWVQNLKIPEIANFSQESFESLGYYLAPFIDSSSYRSFCPTSVHFNSRNILFRTLGKILQTDTEGLYLGQRLNGLKDLIFIKESALKRRWFYFKNGIPTTPSESTVHNYAIYFIQDGDVFQLKGLEEIQSDQFSMAHDLLGLTTSYPTHDRKIGCIPKH